MAPATAARAKAWVELDERAEEETSEQQRNQQQHQQSLLKDRAKSPIRVAACILALLLVTTGAAVFTKIREGAGVMRAFHEFVDPRYNPGGWDADDDDDDDDPVITLKNELHLLTPDEAQQRFGALSSDPRAHRTYARRPHQTKIEHMVVLYMENHAADHFFGCMDLPGW